MKKVYLLACIALLVQGVFAQPALEPGVPGSLSILNPVGVQVTVGLNYSPNHQATNMLTVINTAAGKRLLFSASDATNGNEVWISDGTAEGTVLLKDINPGVGNSDPSQFIPIGNVTYFAATSASNGRELWKTNGTAAGTMMVMDLNEGPASANPNYLTAWNGKLLFKAIDTFSDNIDPALAKSFLYISDGTETGTVRIYDVVPIPGNWSIYPLFTSLGNKFVFPGDDGRHGCEYWVSDGTYDGTRMLLDINFNPNDPLNPELGTKGLYIDWMQRAGKNQAVFRPNPSGYWLGRDSIVDTHNEPWVTDGTSIGTYPLKDIWELNPGGDLTKTGNSAYGESILYKNLVWFRANDGTSPGENWTTDLTEANTKQFIDINGRVTAEGANGNSQVQRHIIFGKYLFFRATVSNVGWEQNLFNVATGAELYFTDGTVPGTKLFADINPGTGNSTPNYPVVVNGKLYFTASDNASDIELYCAINPDSTAVYTWYKVFNAEGNSNHTNLVNMNGVLYLVSADKILYKYDDGVAVKANDAVNQEDHWVPYSGVRNIRVLAGDVDTCALPGMPVNCVFTTSSQKWLNPIEENIGIYPNPGKSHISITYKGDLRASVAIFNQTGQKVMLTEAGKNEQIDISRLSPGYYLVVASFKDGRHAREKLLIQR